MSRVQGFLAGAVAPRRYIAELEKAEVSSSRAALPSWAVCNAASRKQKNLICHPEVLCARTTAGFWLLA